MAILDGMALARNGRGDVRFRAADVACEPFCDYLNISVPRDIEAALLDELMPVLDGTGFAEVQPGLWRYASAGGTVKRRNAVGVAVYSASGGALGYLRDRVAYSDYLSAFGAFPHRVTRLDATVDYIVPGPEIVPAVASVAEAGRMCLTARPVLAKNVHVIRNTDIDGNITGTVYLGKRQNADVVGVVYDKRHERICRGLDDPGPRTRVELSFGEGIGISLRDAAEPSGVFFHYGGRMLVEGPSGVVPWVAGAEGFVCSKRPEKTAEQRIRALLEADGALVRAKRIAQAELSGDWRQKLEQIVGAVIALKGPGEGPND